ncbi:MAG: glycosyltransferase [Saprospiraceae bacterium]|nr:glycosyltransferase [Saprospiraceae bacterium]
MQYDVIQFSLFRTDNPYSSISLSMARELAKTVRVLYVNHPYSWKDLWSGLWRRDRVLLRRLPGLLLFQNVYESLDSIPERFTAVTPPPTLPINWLPPGRVYRFFQGLNNWIILNAIRRAARKQGFERFVYLNCYDPFFAGYLPPDTGAVCSIYHCIDDISQDTYTARHGLQLENEACAQADITLVTSTNLYRLKKPVARRVEHFFNAADVSVFQRVLNENFPRPPELGDRPGQVVGFVGNLDALRIDYALLHKIALAFPDKTLLLVGPLNSKEPEQIGLTRLPNVILAGARKLEELPALLKHMDCVLIPFLCNTLTYSIYPLKINEYLAAGKPVVSTAFSADIRTFANCCYLAEDHDVFLQQIEKALSENDSALITSRTKVAATNTWEARINQLGSLIG